MTIINMTSSAAPHKTALVIGATSSLAASLCRELAIAGYRLILAARDERELEIRAGDIAVRYGVECIPLQVDLLEKNFSAAELMRRANVFDTVIFAAGDMGSSEQDDLTNLRHVAMINYVVPCEILSLAAETLVERGGGTIIVIGSVAGDRGRASNYEYGAAKAALAAFASGLRNRYAKKHVHVMTVKPGFTDTPMTWGMQSPLIASREMVARIIMRGMQKKKDVLYVPWFWRYIMLIIRHIPEAIFKKLSL
jgi:decaprenylphospho-beta-D-erythro-pentofuranosid-2-ulose 2-reductase